jgi:hypothetical protein
VADDENRPGTALARTREQTQHALQRVIGGKAPNEEVFWCMSCGFAEDPEDPSKVRYPKGLTLQFEPDEIAALGNDIRSYSGPCPCCDFMSLVPMDKFTGGTIQGMARENRDADHRAMAKTFVDVVKEEVVGGSLFSGGPPDVTPEQAGGVPGQRPDLPDADDIDDADLKPRGSQ